MNQYQYTYEDCQAGHHHEYIMPALEKLLPDSSGGKKLLDIGCGNGSITNALQKKGFEATGVESSEMGLRQARDAFPDCDFVHASLYDLAPQHFSHSFDVVIAVEVIEHLLHPRELLRVASRLLKPDGSMILSTPYHGYLKNLMIALSGKSDRHWDPLWDGGHVKFWSTDTLTKLFEQEGWNTPHFAFAGRCPALWKSMLCRSSLGDKTGD